VDDQPLTDAEGAVNRLDAVDEAPSGGRSARVTPFTSGGLAALRGSVMPSSLATMPSRV
jgi:hypothetical protein